MMGGIKPRPGHRERIRQHHDPGRVHELTFSCYHRWALLTSDLWRGMLAESIDRAIWPILPDNTLNCQPSTACRPSGWTRRTSPPETGTAGRASSGTRRPRTATVTPSRTSIVLGG